MRLLRIVDPHATRVTWIYPATTTAGVDTTQLSTTNLARSHTATSH